MTASGLTSESPPDGRNSADGADGVRVGSVLGGYRLEEQIGRGGMAVVFRATDERLGRQVAVKILAPALGADRAFRRRFVRESRAAAMIDDPHIIPIFQAGESGGLLFIAMRLVSGGDVRGLVCQHGPLPVARSAEPGKANRAGRGTGRDAAGSGKRRAAGRHRKRRWWLFGSA